MAVLREVHRHGCYLLSVPEYDNGSISVHSLYVSRIAFGNEPIPESLISKVREHSSELCSILAKMA